MKAQLDRQMKTYLKTLGAIVVLVMGMALCKCHAQTDTNGVPGNLQLGLNFLGSGSNWMVAPYGIYDMGSKKPGGGVGLFYALTPNVVTGMRLDYVDGSLFMPSGDLQLQLPINITTNIALVPFTFAGIAAPISGSGFQQDVPVGIFGIGGALKITKKWDIVGDYEKWTGFKGSQLRFGFLYKF